MSSTTQRIGCRGSARTAGAAARAVGAGADATPAAALRAADHPRAALSGFAVSVLAHNVLAVLEQSIGHAHRRNHADRDVSIYHLALGIASGYGPMLRLFPPEQRPCAGDDSR